LSDRRRASAGCALKEKIIVAALEHFSDVLVIAIFAL